MLPERDLKTATKPYHSKFKSHHLTLAEIIFQTLFCPSSKNLLYKNKPSSKMSCLSQQVSFVVINKQFLQQHLYH